MFMPTEVQRKHRREREAVIDDALHTSLDHLEQAYNHFGTAINSSDLRTRFDAGLGSAREVLRNLGVEKAE